MRQVTKSYAQLKTNKTPKKLGSEGVGRNPVGALVKLYAHVLRLRARDPVVDLAGPGEELPEDRPLRCQAGELWHVLGQAHASVRGAHTEAVLAAEEALGRG